MVDASSLVLKPVCSCEDQHREEVVESQPQDSFFWSLTHSCVSAEIMDSSELTAPLVEHRSRKLGKRNELQTILVIFLFTKTGNLVKNVLTRFWKQNESTLDLVDGLTTSVAELQDTCAYAKEGGHAADKDTTETAPIIHWLAKVQEVQVNPHPNSFKSSNRFLKFWVRPEDRLITFYSRGKNAFQ